MTGDERQPSQELIDKYGPEVFDQAKKALYWARHNRGVRAEEQQPERPKAVDLSLDLRNCDAAGYPLVVKIWPMVGLAAIRSNKAGAWRVWHLARALDPQGSGKVKRSALWAFIAHLGVVERTRRRWIRAAIDLGIFRLDEKSDSYYLKRNEDVSPLMGARKVGSPVLIEAKGIVVRGWRKNVWAAFEALHNGKQISQVTKEQVTGVPERTQRHYRRQSILGVRRNYGQTNLSGDHLVGLRENGRETAFTGNDGFLYYRLPDTTEVPSTIAAPCRSKGRSRKVQKRINTLLLVEQGSDQVMRQFFNTPKGIKSAIRRLGDLLPWERPREFHLLDHVGKRSNLWRPEAVSVHV